MIQAPESALRRSAIALLWPWAAAAHLLCSWVLL